MKLLTAKDVAAKLTTAGVPVSEWTIRNWCTGRSPQNPRRAAGIKAIIDGVRRIGGRIYVEDAAVDQLIVEIQQG